MLFTEKKGLMHLRILGARAVRVALLGLFSIVLLNFASTSASAVTCEGFRWNGDYCESYAEECNCPASGTAGCSTYLDGDGCQAPSCDYSSCGFQGAITIDPASGPYSSAPSVTYTVTDPFGSLTGGSWAVYYVDGPGCTPGSSTASGTTSLGDHTITAGDYFDCGDGFYTIHVNAQDFGGDSGNKFRDYYIGHWNVHLKIYVKDAGGDPIVGANVTVVGVDTKATDANGLADFTVLSNNTFDYTVAKADYSSDPGSVYVGHEDKTVNVIMNKKPSVDAGEPKTITLPDSATLDGTVTDDGLPNPPGKVTSSWTKVSGPGTVTFGESTAVDTTATFSAAGIYVLGLTANDSKLTDYDEVTITVNPANVAPTITTQPTDQSVSVGATATFSVVATGVPAPSYQWRKNGSPIAGATSASYTTPATTLLDSGAIFTVVVTNTAGSVTSDNATLTVSVTPVAPTITTQPTPQTVSVGATATFSVVATGVPAPSYQWRRNGSDIPGATAASYTTPPTALSDDGAMFTVYVYNSQGSVTSTAVRLTVTSSSVAPTITTQPTPQTVSVGATATFSVVATGVPAPSYQWRRNGSDIPGATAASYTTPPTALSDDGAMFTVYVYNSVGGLPSTAVRLTVTASSVAPTITTQPTPRTVSVGETATFSVVATGVPAPSYQWRKNGSPIAGATSASYTTPATAASDDGAIFTVVVTNSQGSVTSAGARLTVNPAPAQAPGDLLSNAHAYPIPYKPSVHGNGITFNNLSNDATVVIKIFTVAGELVQELRNSSAQAEVNWPVTNQDGQAVASGVYIYHIRNSTGDEKRGKLMIAR